LTLRSMLVQFSELVFFASLECRICAAFAKVLPAQPPSRMSSSHLGRCYTRHGNFTDRRHLLVRRPSETTERPWHGTASPLGRLHECYRGCTERRHLHARWPSGASARPRHCLLSPLDRSRSRHQGCIERLHVLARPRSASAEAPCPFPFALSWSERPTTHPHGHSPLHVKVPPRRLLKQLLGPRGWIDAADGEHLLDAK